MNLKNKLKELRIENKLNQSQVAQAINISRVQYNQYENNYYCIPIKHLVNVSTYYNVSIDYILNLNNIKKYPDFQKIDNIKAGERLRQFRKENKLTQEKLASILNTTFSNIAFYEKGRNLIATPFLYEICKKYNISADYLLGKIDNPKYLK